MTTQPDVSKNVPKPIKITISDGGSLTTYDGAIVKAVNRSTNESIIAYVKGNKAIIDCTNFENGYSSGDIIELNVSGNTFGSNTVTLSGDKPQSVTITTADETTSTTAAINL